MQQELLESRHERREKKLQASAILRELLVYSCFAALVLVVAYGTTTGSETFQQVKSLENHLLGSGKPVRYQVGQETLSLAKEPQFLQVPPPLPTSQGASILRALKVKSRRSCGSSCGQFWRRGPELLATTTAASHSAKEDSSPIERRDCLASPSSDRSAFSRASAGAA